LYGRAELQLAASLASVAFGVRMSRKGLSEDASLAAAFVLMLVLPNYTWEAPHLRVGADCARTEAL
jgi:hypothetical protein